METALRVSGVALISVFSVMLLKERYRNAGIAVILSAVVLIALFSVDRAVRETVTAVIAFGEESGLSRYSVILMKALGISYITALTESLCRDTGEGTLAFVVDFSGKAQLLLLSIPLIEELLDIAASLV